MRSSGAKRLSAPQPLNPHWRSQRHTLAPVRNHLDLVAHPGLADATTTRRSALEQTNNPATSSTATTKQRPRTAIRKPLRLHSDRELDAAVIEPDGRSLRVPPDVAPLMFALNGGALGAAFGV